MKEHHLLASNFGIENFIGKINKFKMNKFNFDFLTVYFNGTHETKSVTF
jgi:hypothetical protein